MLALETEHHGKGTVEEDSFEDKRKYAPILKKLLIIFKRPGFEVPIKYSFIESKDKLTFIIDGINFPIHIKYFAFIKGQTFDHILVCVRMNGFFVSLAQ